MDSEASGGSSPDSVTLTDAVERTALGTQPNPRHRLLKTPTSNLGANGGAQHPDKRKAGGHGPTLADEVEHLLPTPMQADGERGSMTYARGNPTLAGSVGALLPTPRTTDSHGIGAHGNGGQDLRTMVAVLGGDERVASVLLPTPTVGNANGSNTRRGGERSDELLLPGVAEQVHEHPAQHDRAATWGPYWPAVDRWERLRGVEAPRPTLPDGKGGRQRMNAELPEWMMGLHRGHITAVPGVNRQAALKAAGNGVVPQQAALGVRTVLERWYSDGR
jgi:hypothetical protein